MFQIASIVNHQKGPFWSICLMFDIIKHSINTQNTLLKTTNRAIMLLLDMYNELFSFDSTLIAQISFSSRRSHRAQSAGFL